MNILIFSPVFDPAGVGLNLAHALNTYTEHTCRNAVYLESVCWNRDLLDRVESITLEKEENYERLFQFLEEADIVHINLAIDFMNFFKRPAESRRLLKEELFQTTLRPKHPNEPHFNKKKPVDIAERLAGKRVVLHGHGGVWLLCPDLVIEKCRELRARIVTCSPIDERVVPGARWIPNVLPLSQAGYFPAERDFSGRLVCSQAFGDGLYKGKGIVQYVFEWLPVVKEGFNIGYEFLTGMPINESLQIRRRHHFTVDNWTQGFHGMAGLEGLALGHVVFSRFDPMARDKWQGFSHELIPIIDVKGMDEFAKYLRLFNDDRELLRERCRQSRAWMERYYREEQIARLWIDFYESL